MFPWQSGLCGDEVSSPHATGCVMEFSTPAIAEAFLHYAHATGDRCFLREDAWPILRGAADWVCSRVTRTARGLEVRNLTVSETYENTHNDPATSRGFVKLLRNAVALATELGLSAPANWSNVADNIPLPIALAIAIPFPIPFPTLPEP